MNVVAVPAIEAPPAAPATSSQTAAARVIDAPPDALPTRIQSVAALAIDAPPAARPTRLPAVAAPAVDAPPAASATSLQATISLPPAAPAEPIKQAGPEPEKRRALPSPFDSPPFPGTEYQGYPIIGVPPDTTMWPFMRAIQGTPLSDILNGNRWRLYGWITTEGNLSNAKNSNTPDSYWVRPNHVDVDQAVIRLDRSLDSVQVDHIDYGFKFTFDWGIDYRYFTAGGWFSDQLLKHNNLYGYDLTECYYDLYIPWVTQGMIVRIGRWIACPDIETQFAPDNYMGSHSLLFTFDTYTQTGIMTTFKLSDQWTAQGVVHSGTDMAPWYKGALVTGACGVRWVSLSNNDATYTWLNAINSAQYRHFDEDGVEAGHDNFNYLVSTWEHRFNPGLVTKTEAYFMWQRNGVVGGTPSLGPLESFGGGGGSGPVIPGLTLTWGVVNFTIVELSKWDFITFRNEYWKDTDGERSGYAGVYTSNAIGWSHNFNADYQIRPEIGFYRNWTQPAFDLGTKKNLYMLGCDFTVHF